MTPAPGAKTLTGLRSNSCRGHRCGRVETQDHAAHITLVEDIRTDDFRNQGVTKALSRGNRLDRAGLFRRRQRDVSGLQDRRQVTWLQPQWARGVDQHPINHGPHCTMGKRFLRE